MADYKDIKGFTVQNLASDPTTPSAIGQFYYNSTSNAFKYVQPGGVSAGTWASGGNTNTQAGQRGSASLSTNSNAFVSGGFNAGAGTVTSNAESYNGTSWAEGPNQPGTSRLGGSWGATNSYVTAGGSIGPGGAPINAVAFEWNGSSFSNGGSLNNARRNAAGAGISETAGRVYGGGDNPGPAQNFNEGYNGSVFSNDTAMNTARVGPVGFGTTTAAIAAGGGGTVLNELWNGTSWTELGDLTGSMSNSGGRAGTSTDGLIFSKNGTPPGAQSCQFWDGTSWTEVADQSVNRYNNTGGGPDSTNAISVGGYGPPSAVAQATEEWAAPSLVIKTVTTS